jgi:hypothetical protein
MLNAQALREVWLAEKRSDTEWYLVLAPDEDTTDGLVTKPTLDTASDELTLVEFEDIEPDSEREPF